MIGREIEEMMHGSFDAVGPETGLVLLAGDPALYRLFKAKAIHV